MIKSILKLVASLAVGMAIGLCFASIFIVLFTEMTFTEFWQKFASQFSDIWKMMLVGIFSMIAAVVILIIIHEGGHLVAGLLTGYKFVSFRIFNWTFIRINGKLTVKKFAVAGTGGQCLMSPPDVSLDKMPVAWYNLGGIIANLIAALLVLPLLFVDCHTFVTEFALIFLVIDAFLLIVNGIPMKVGGITNDAHNVLYLRKNPKAMLGLVLQLKFNAASQNGLRPKDMPEEWFNADTDINYRNALELAPLIMLGSRYLDMEDYGKSIEIHEQLYSHKEEIIKLYVNEIASELVYLYLIKGDTEHASQLYDNKLKTYTENYQKVLSSKKRLLCAIALKMENDREKAQTIYDELKAQQSDYLLQGEVASDLHLMQSLLSHSA